MGGLDDPDRRIAGSTLLWANLSNTYVWVVLMVTVSFGAIGFYDDYLKVTKQSHKGISGKIRLALEAVIAGIACLFHHADRSRRPSRPTLPCPSSRTCSSISAGSTCPSPPS
jgi:UDP-N-acetylmuramyl pentapeptide phosphotransferase/UDP-N-acetylglucosamine-1-phosphate transferase